MLKNYIDAAISRRQCDIVLKGAQYVDVFCGELKRGDIAIDGDRIVGVGSYSGKREYDVSGLVVAPAFIDAHVHIESSLLSPQGFASLVVPRGTATVIADPHEIANVCGYKGVEYLISSCAETPLTVKIMLPSCVPATPFETSGASLSSEDIKGVIEKNEVFGLGEFMNYPAVISADGEALSKLCAAEAAGKPRDGHAPSLRGKELNAYLCGGITTDHECADVAEIEEKLSKGMYIALRHGSTARNVEANCRAVNARNYRRFLMCTDDRHAADIAQNGHIDDALRTAVRCGVDPVIAVTIATLNAAECYGLKRRGAVAPYYFADLVVIDDLKDFNVRYVFREGKLVARDGKLTGEIKTAPPPECVLGTVRLPKLKEADFKLALRGERARAITMECGSLVTGCAVERVQSRDGDVVLTGTDLNKLIVVERHRGTGNIGKGLIKGYGFKGGAIGITVSHDSHNLIILGDDNAAMLRVANELERAGGGMAIAESGKPVLCAPLQIAGLMSADAPGEFIRRSGLLYERAYACGVKSGYDAYLSLAFLSLAVIPHLKLLDTGLFDVDKFAFTDVNAD